MGVLVSGIIDELKRALSTAGIQFTQLQKFRLLCESPEPAPSGQTEQRAGPPKLVAGVDRAVQVSWEMDVIVLPKLGLHGIKLHRVSGDIWRYKNVIAHMMSFVKL